MAGATPTMVSFLGPTAADEDSPDYCTVQVQEHQM